MKELKINPELRDFIPPLSGEEKKSLEDSLLKYGYKGAAIYIWHDYIVDGHNRYELCRKHNIDYPVEELELGNDATIIDVMEWMINTQLGRRNLPPAHRLALVNKFKQKIQEEAKKNQGFRKSNKISKIDIKSIHTDKEIAKLAGVGTGTVARFNRIMSSNDEELKKKVLANKIKINTAYEQIREKEQQGGRFLYTSPENKSKSAKQSFDILSNALLEKIESCDCDVYELHEIYNKIEDLKEKIQNIVKEKNNKLIVPECTEILSCKILHSKLNFKKIPNEYQIRELASNWEDKLCDPIHVSYRDGQYGIVEGQKRKLSKMMIDSDGTLVCHIYRGLTEEDEYQLFSQLNNGKRTYGTNEDYEARSRFDPKWKYVIGCVSQAGFSIVYSGGAKENTFGCAATLEEIYDDMGEIDFTEMLKMLKNICDGIKYSLQATFLKGFAKFYATYKTSIIDNEFKKMFVDKDTKKIIKKSFTKISEKADTYTQTKNVGIKTAFGILMSYNECCSKKNRLSFGAFDSLIN